MRRSFASIILLGVLALSAQSDEGMWLLNDPPKKLLKDKYHFDLTDAWLDKAMKASVRFNNGGSGGFVSPDGLIVTNHHIAADSLQKLSTKECNLHRDGFLARKREDELKCPDLELNVLQEILDVTHRVNAAVKPEMNPGEAAAARKAEMGKIEKESLDETGFRSDVVTLYQGGLYHLYRYKKYTDVRLVFAPEHAAAFFGGDADNFEYPRFNLDVAFFRAYEKGEPVRSEHFFKWSAAGPTDGDLAFVVGHPGMTNRLETSDTLIHRRDVTFPYTLNRLRSMEMSLEQYSLKGAEQKRQAATDLHRFANSRKALSGQYQGLLDRRTIGFIATTGPTPFVGKIGEELLLSRKLGELDPGSIQALRSNYDQYRAAIRAAQARLQTFEIEYLLVESAHSFSSELFTIARHLVRLATELPKNSADRLREYRDSNLESLKHQLFSPAPIHLELERAKLVASLTFMAENLGGGNPVVEHALLSRGVLDTADKLTRTRLVDVGYRHKLFDGGIAAILASGDPMINLAERIDDRARALRKQYEAEVEEPERQAYAGLAGLRFKAFGKNVAPDATFTLRLAFGTVGGYEVDGKKLPFATTFGGAFEKAEAFNHQEPNELPKRWLDGKAKLDPKTPFNFVSTADTIGGNSGSPVLNRAGELVGINFDRNRHGLVRNFVYTDVQARHIAVHSKAVLEALSKLYDAPGLLAELTGK